MTTFGHEESSCTCIQIFHNFKNTIYNVLLVPLKFLRQSEGQGHC